MASRAASTAQFTGFACATERIQLGINRRVIIEPIYNAALHRWAIELFAPLTRSTTELWESYTDEQLAVILDFMTRGEGIMRDETRKLSELPRSRARVNKPEVVK